jgi:hypothetical protein
VTALLAVVAEVALVVGIIAPAKVAPVVAGDVAVAVGVRADTGSTAAATGAVTPGLGRDRLSRAGDNTETPRVRAIAATTELPRFILP